MGAVASVTAGGRVAIEIHTMGEYWRDDRGERTELGDLVQAAKDRADPGVLPELEQRVVAWIARFAVADEALLVAVPPSPDRPSPVLDELYRRVAVRAGLATTSTVVRHNGTARLRDLEPAERPAVAQAAGYEVLDGCVGRAILLIDDVVLTGTTLRHLGALLLDAGAASVVGLALARSRRG